MKPTAKHARRWADGHPFLYDVAMAVRAGADTIAKLHEQFPEVHIETVTNVCRQLSDAGTLRVETRPRDGGGRVNVYSVRIMPPEPVEPEHVSTIKHPPTVTELERVWPIPVAPLPQARAKYVKRPVGPI